MNPLAVNQRNARKITIRYDLDFDNVQCKLYAIDGKLNKQENMSFVP
jgi:hypothetical protein